MAKQQRPKAPKPKHSKPPQEVAPNEPARPKGTPKTRRAKPAKEVLPVEPVSATMLTKAVSGPTTTAPRGTASVQVSDDEPVSCVCGLDVHSNMIMACLWKQPPGQRRPEKVVQQFGTFHDDLLKLKEWLLQHGCQQVGMESTGVYWIPIFNELETSFDVSVGNARHLKNVPARKTDVKDAEWLSELLYKGFFNKSFVPDAPFRELRKLMRFRHNLVDARTEERNLVLKHLEFSGTKLATVATDVFGVSGMKILNALALGRSSAAELADLAVRQLRKKIPELERALQTQLTVNDRWLLTQQLERLAQHDKAIAAVEAKLKEDSQPYAKELALLDTIPGVNFIAAITMIAELGTDWKAFADEHRLSAWVGLAPGNNESNGKQVGSRRRHGNTFLTTLLVEAAWAAIRVKGSFLRAKYYRLKARMNAKKAIFAIAHKMLVAAYRMLKTGETYREKGEDFARRVDSERQVRRAIKTLEAQGYAVQLLAKDLAPDELTESVPSI